MENTPGFRFYPTEEELISFYLQHKLQATTTSLPNIDRVIPVVYIYDYNPWELPKLSGEGCRSDPQQQEWFFFIPKQEREVRGGRPNRLTTTGYWKATGSPGYVYSSHDNKIIGVKRTMVFYRGRARTRSGSKTDWKMNEYMAIHHHQQPSSSSSSNNPIPIVPSQTGDYTICRVYLKSKCLRSFDRRPGAPMVNKPRLMIDQQPSSSSDHQYGHNNQAQPRVETIMRSNSSGSSSSSGDNNNNNHHQVHNIHQEGTNNNNNNNNNNNGNEQEQNVLDMDIDHQAPLWEWDSLMNWNNNL